MFNVLINKLKNLGKNESIFSDYMVVHESISSQMEKLKIESNYLKKLRIMMVNYLQLRNLEKVCDIEKKVITRLDRSQQMINMITNKRSKEHYQERILSFKTKICSFPIDIREISPFIDYINFQDENIFLKFWNSLNSYLDCQKKGTELEELINSPNTRLYHSERERYDLIVKSKLDSLSFSNVEETLRYLLQNFEDVHDSIKKAEKVIQNSRVKIDHLLEQVEKLNDYSGFFDSDFTNMVDDIHHRLLELLSNVLELDHVMDELIIIENKVHSIESELDTFNFQKEIYKINEKSTVSLLGAAAKYYEDDPELDSLKSGLEQHPKTITNDRLDSLNESLLNVKSSLVDILNSHGRNNF